MNVWKSGAKQQCLKLNADYDKNEGFQFSLSGSIVNE
jgi:hypothetical protein